MQVQRRLVARQDRIAQLAHAAALVAVRVVKQETLTGGGVEGFAFSLGFRPLRRVTRCALRNDANDEAVGWRVRSLSSTWLSHEPEPCEADQAKADQEP